ncbi:MAG: 30S ribosomal protein THX [Bacteroidota bacterium]|nr:30S ribosomal protein THX [Bacteroidota bacterium]
MGRGDKKTKKGKIFMGSFGKSRPVTKNVKRATENVKDKKEA